MAKFYMYSVEVENNKGEVEKIINDSYNPQNYNNMIELYRKTRDELNQDHKNINKITFYGITENEEKEMLFFKEYKNENKKDTITEICESIVDNMEKFKKISEEIPNQISLIDKQISILYHIILNEGQEFDNDKKIEYFNKLNAHLKARSEIKYEHQRLVRIIGKFADRNVGTNVVINMFKEIYNINNDIDKQIKIGKDKYCEENADDNIKYIKFNSEKERISLHSQLKNKYDRVILDIENNQFIVFDVSYETNKRKVS